MSAATLKAAALALLNSGATWTQGALARRANGTPCSPMSASAARYDVMGALIRAQSVSAEPNLVSFHAAYDQLRAKIPSGYKNEDIESFNDDTNWAGVAALFT